eukprot:CAMPEP_0194777880 /NCGR_PEP_ID=MMETSP0323_2-20130528/66797_1 /TAXON_ID=2866 ORGANISM="Crypthecodinium cohnii, Strain Seligo" /NCGR_SAMPLE_ID=MMETSP0323_2 /ASSEMBLY_ACC=CAM_ASM_000346 /LENGTH=113 /DNA_ID=CAMNT_0039714839 /DNA_START=14 /DNA_END=355 /DNA_ORIENTATION=+
MPLNFPDSKRSATSSPPPTHLPWMKTRGKVRAPVVSSRNFPRAFSCFQWTSLSTSKISTLALSSPRRMVFAMLQNGQVVLEKTMHGLSSIICWAFTTISGGASGGTEKQRTAT